VNYSSQSQIAWLFDFRKNSRLNSNQCHDFIKKDLYSMTQIEKRKSFFETKARRGKASLRQKREEEKLL